MGAFWALYQAEHLGVPAEDALEMGREAGMGGMEAQVRDILGVDKDPWETPDVEYEDDPFEGC